jgi:hypothetical protein
MSPTDARRISDAATVRHPTGPSDLTRSGGERAFLQDRAASQRPPATDPRPSRPVIPARVGPSRNLRPHSLNDPCNYLG